MKKLLLFGFVFLTLVLVTSSVAAMTKDEYVARVADKVKEPKMASSDDSGVRVIEYQDGEDKMLRMNKAQLIDSIAKDAKLTKADSKKVVRFKAGSDLAKTVKSVEYESGGWMKIMKKRAGAATGETMHGAIASHKGIDGLDPETEVIEYAQDGEDVSIWGSGRAHYSKWRSWDLDGKGTDNVGEDVELAIETLRLEGKITDDEAANAMAALEERKITWAHKKQNTESEADWLDK